MQNIKRTADDNQKAQLENEVARLNKKIAKYEAIELKQNRFGLVWLDVPEAFEDDVENKLPILEEVPKLAIKSKDNKPTHLLIEGDNYHALTCLNYTHKGKVDVIYIDPPYNTGSDGFKYKDKRILKEYPDGTEVPVDHPLRHSYWLSFMKKRLELARDILSETGVIFVSIDDNELAQLKLLMDEVFVENNFISILSVENNPKGRKNSNYISTSNEYCLIYAKKKDASYFKEIIPKDEKDMAQDDEGNYIHNSGKRVIVGENKFNKLVSNFNSDKHYSVYFNKKLNDLILKKENKLKELDSKLLKNGYKRYISYFNNNFVENTYTAEKFKSLFNANQLDIKEEKIYEKNFSNTIRLKSILTNKKYKAIVNGQPADYEIDLKTTSAQQGLRKMFGKDIFNFPKNSSFIKLLIQLSQNDNAVILDFFAGSGTTGQAVMELNAEDGGSRQFILVTNNDEITNGQKHKIMTDICYPRMEKVIKGYNGNKGLGNSVRYFRTAFVGKNNILTADDADKIELAHNAGGMLAMSENTFNQVEKNDYWQIFESPAQCTAVYFREEFGKFDDFVERVEKLKKPTVVYIFSWEKDFEFTDFDDNQNIKVKTIPQPILEIYKEIYNLV